MNNALNFIGIINKSGNLIIGYNNCEKAIKSKVKLFLVIVACDVSENTYELFERLSSSGNFKLVKCFSKKNLGNILGKEEIGVIGIKDYKLSVSMLNKINSGGELYGQDKSI